MICILGMTLAVLLGLAFGSFMNVCLSRWPKEESILRPGSHCPACGHPLAWWENIPLLSWLVLRGRCRACRSPIPVRYPLVEAATGILFGIKALQTCATVDVVTAAPRELGLTVLHAAGWMAFYWFLLALALLDLGHLWLPNRLTYPGILLGVAVNLILIGGESPAGFILPNLALAAEKEVLAILSGAAVILAIRWLYWLVRRREGIGLGDAKLMALLGAWLGFPGMLLGFALGVLLGATIALVLLGLPLGRRGEQAWSLTQLPFGTFLCVGGIVSGLWGERILAAYLRWAGL